MASGFFDILILQGLWFSKPPIAAVPFGASSEIIESGRYFSEITEKGQYLGEIIEVGKS
jgi:hypothetical protein